MVQGLGFGVWGRVWAQESLGGLRVLGVLCVLGRASVGGGFRVLGSGCFGSRGV